VQSFSGDDRGRVFGQSPGANSRVQPGSRVTIWILG
jgi:beta-lactam-binding protein with PASTA domain